MLLFLAAIHYKRLSPKLARRIRRMGFTCEGCLRAYCILWKNMKKPSRLPWRLFSARIIFAVVVHFLSEADEAEVRRSRSRRREKWKKWDCVCQSSGKAPNQRVKHGKTCSRKAVSLCFMVIFCLRGAFAEPSRGFAEKPLYYLQKRRIAFTLPKVMMKIWHWPLKNFWIEYELLVWVALHV